MIQGWSSTRCELAVLGAVLVDQGTLSIACEILTPESFTDGRGHLFQMFCEMRDEKRDIDVSTAKDEMSRHSYGLPESILSDCIDAIQSASHMPSYVRSVEEAYCVRKMIEACRKLASTADSQNLKDVEKWLRRKDQLGTPLLFEYSRQSDIMTMLDSLDKKKQSEIVDMGFKEMDRAIRGSKPGEINTWAAATNTGKSILLLNLMDKAMLAGKRCLWLGTEMSSMETAHRHLSILSSVHQWKIRSGDLDLDEASSINTAATEIMLGKKVAMLDDSEPTLELLDAAMASFKPDVVFLDYLERFSLPREENLRLRIKEFMRRLKTLARKRNVVVHLAAQLNRQSYGSEDARPNMSQISESSAVEKESDRIMLIWAPTKENSDLNITNLEVIVAKNRHGHKGTTHYFQLDKSSLRITERLSPFTK